MKELQGLRDLMVEDILEATPEEILAEMAEDMGMPTPNLECVRIYWDDTTQSVKREIIKIADIHNQTSDE